MPIAAPVPRLLEVPGYLKIIGQHVKNGSPITRALPQLVSLADIPRRLGRLPRIAVPTAQERICHRKLGSISIARCNKGTGRRDLAERRILRAPLYCFNASREGVVASASGVSRSVTVAGELRPRSS